MARLKVLLAGGTGLVGRALMKRLLADPQVGAVHALCRRVVPDWPAMDNKLRPLQVDFAALPVLPPLDEAYLALGTTMQQAGSKEAFRAVDFDAMLACARAAKAAGAKRVLAVSAHGAGSGSSVFYNQVKGEAEEAIAALGFDSVVFARPSLLLGDRALLGQPKRGGEGLAQRWLAPLGRLIPASVRPIAADAVAAALIAAARPPSPGVRVLRSAEMQPR
jgi:uncharacterized protein YbjT (DUF2867 family)